MFSKIISFCELWFSYIDGTTCTCEEKIYANFHLQQPYTGMGIDPVSFDIQYNGLFPTVLQKVIYQTCGVCQMTSTTNYTSKITFKSNGNGNVAFKDSVQRVLDDIDFKTTTSLVSFPMQFSPNSQSVFVPIIKYPGAILLVRKIDSQELVNKILMKMANCWPIIAIYLLCTLVSASCLWSLVCIAIFTLKFY